MLETGHKSLSPLGTERRMGMFEKVAGRQDACRPVKQPTGPAATRHYRRRAVADLAGGPVVATDPGGDASVPGAGVTDPVCPVCILGVLPNPHGADEGNETVTLGNSGEVAVELTGWKLRDKEASGSGPSAPAGSTWS
jgi:hypothetical protein